ncbi:hypothetical protein THIX_60609 [Thiomonas sp. X19]|nr:hypothetical protein THIX_60609 [Thiomonas sp. X19]
MLQHGVGLQATLNKSRVRIASLPDAARCITGTDSASP